MLVSATALFIKVSFLVVDSKTSQSISETFSTTKTWQKAVKENKYVKIERLKVISLFTVLQNDCSSEYAADGTRNAFRYFFLLHKFSCLSNLIAVCIPQNDKLCMHFPILLSIQSETSFIVTKGALLKF